ncbi:MAG TPA: hypothetical protein VLA83_19205 [Candidatus Binatia bacterium]|nr:hypothetical protein [Candidatus Binatia bacterium]
MKRLTSLAILGTAALLISSSLYAQRGMSGRGGGGGSFHSGGAGFRSGPSGGFRSAGPAGVRSAPGGFRSGPGFSSFGPRTPGLSSFAPSHRTFSTRPFVSSQHVFVNRPFGFRHFHNHFGFFNSCFGCSPFFFGGGLFLGAPFYPYYPGFYGGYYGDGYGGYGPPAPQPVVVNTDNGNSVELAAQVQQLTDEVSDLRSEENRRYYEDRNRAGSGATLSAKEPAAATVFVFRDGHRISAKSYAIAGQTLWIFSEQAARKYQLADLDASATEQVNAANGVEFHVPAPATNH